MTFLNPSTLTPHLNHTDPYYRRGSSPRATSSRLSAFQKKSAIQLFLGSVVLGPHSVYRALINAYPSHMRTSPLQEDVRILSLG